MEKLMNLALIFFSLLMICIQGSYHVNAQESSSHSHQNLCLGKEKITQLRFFVQDIASGDNRTVYQVISIANLSDTLPSAFGQVNVLDDRLTSGIEQDSEEVGRLQGLVVFADLNEMAATVLLNIVFTKGEFNGSTLSILGRNPLLEQVREVPVVGGSGIFRMARGYAFTSSVASGVIQYDVVVYHFKDAASHVDRPNPFSNKL